MSTKNINRDVLDLLQRECRTVRRHIIQMIAEAGGGHPGGALSAVEIVTTLYFHIMRIDPTNSLWPKRDRFVLSKGHASAVLYSVLAERGFFDVEELMTHKKSNSKLAGHPVMNKVPGVDVTTGSLGQGLSVALGLALSARQQGEDFRVYVMLGDGEVQEGQVWEAAMAAGHYQVSNLTAFIDRNHLQIDGSTSEIMNIEPLRDKWRSFGWNVLTIDGHDISEILLAVNEAKQTRNAPTMIIANTTKGKGVSFMENEVSWHGKAPDKELTSRALNELVD